MNTTTAIVDVRAATRLRRMMRSASDAEGIVVAVGAGASHVTGVGLLLVEQAGAAARRLRDFVNADEDVDDGKDSFARSLRDSPRNFVRFLRQGVELVRAVQASARDVSDAAVDGFCEVWIGARTALIDQLTIDSEARNDVTEA